MSLAFLLYSDGFLLCSAPLVSLFLPTENKTRMILSIIAVVVVVVTAGAMMMGMIAANRYQLKAAFDRMCSFVAKDLFKFGCQHQQRQLLTENMLVTV